MANFMNSILSLILIYLPVSNLINNNLNKLSRNQILLTDKTVREDKLYNEIDEKSAKTVKFLEYIGNLKHLERSGWVMNKISKPETVAGHMYRMTLILMILNPDELKSTYGLNFDLNKVIKMILLHDVAETITGDFTPYDKINPETKKKLEIDAISYLSSYLPEKQKNNFIELFNEYEERVSSESILTKEIDRIDLILTAFEYEKSEFQRTGKVPDFEEFFDFNFVLSKIHDPQLKELVASIMKQRSAFLKSVCTKDEPTVELKEE